MTTTQEMCTSMQRLCRYAVLEELRQSFGVVLDGEPYTVATDSCVLVAVAGECDVSASIADGVVGLLTVSRYSWRQISLAALRAWAGEPVWDAPCDTCDGGSTCGDCGGRGRVPCTCPECWDEYTRECSACKGAGQGTDLANPVPCPDCLDTRRVPTVPIRPGRVFDMVIDCELLGRALACVDDGPLCGLATHNNTLVLRHPQWQVLLRGMESTVTPEGAAFDVEA